MQAQASPRLTPSRSQSPRPRLGNSITDDFIICLEDEKKFKSMKRHLSVTFGMTPEAYRQRWNLPSDYPMVAPAYAAARAVLAKSSGVGQKGRGGTSAQAPSKLRASKPEVRAAKREDESLKYLSNDGFGVIKLSIAENLYTYVPFIVVGIIPTIRWTTAALLIFLFLHYRSLLQLMDIDNSLSSMFGIMQIMAFLIILYIIKISFIVLHRWIKSDE